MNVSKNFKTDKSLTIKHQCKLYVNFKNYFYEYKKPYKMRHINFNENFTNTIITTNNYLHFQICKKNI